MSLSSFMQERYGAAATIQDERRIKRSASRFWRGLQVVPAGWLQLPEGEAARAAMIEAFDGAYSARDVAMLLDLAPVTIDFRVRASVGYWLSDNFTDVCNS